MEGDVLQNTKVIEQLKVLDNEVKLKILALLTESGAKSITDIAKQLNLNFSTAHKYLEQLEHAGFVRSKQENENRLKRMFYIQDFCVHIDPGNVSRILKGEKVAIIGRTGSGKTSILNALFNMYPIKKGDIFIKGKNIKSLDLFDLR